MKLVAIIQPTRRGLNKTFSAYCPDIPGCIAHGPTEEKALAALQATLAQQMQCLGKLGLEPPKNQCKIRLLEIDPCREEWNRLDFANSCCAAG